LDLGINLIDTARGYNLSEERIGKLLSHRRNEIILSTKVGYGIEGYNDWTYDIILAGIENALKLMRTDYIDIVHLHSCSLDILKKSEVIEALLKAKQQGKIRCAAYSGENEELQFAVEAGVFDSIECSASICEQRVLDNQIKIAKQKGMGVIAKRPIANAPWRFSERPVGEYVEPYWERLMGMKLELKGVSVKEAAIRFIGFEKGVDSFIIGSSSIEHIKENLNILEKGPLSEDIVEYIKNRFKEKDNNWVGQV
jgi:aryl-alcohol dehydrogenase-like predicted oxidoreductase